MFARWPSPHLALAFVLAGCGGSGSGAEERPAPAPSVLPPAAPGARGVEYHRPVVLPVSAASLDDELAPPEEPPLPAPSGSTDAPLHPAPAEPVPTSPPESPGVPL